jgi:hypothetical protein
LGERKNKAWFWRGGLAGLWVLPISWIGALYIFLYVGILLIVGIGGQRVAWEAAGISHYIVDIVFFAIAFAGYVFAIIKSKR